MHPSLDSFIETKEEANELLGEAYSMLKHPFLTEQDEKGLNESIRDLNSVIDRCNKWIAKLHN